MKRSVLTLGFAVLVFGQIGATDCGTVIRDPGFDLWCGDSLCSWKLTRGDIDRVGTWNAGDSGVSFVGADTAIQQLAPVNSFDGDCISFNMIANVSPQAEMVLNIDLEGDGTIEKTESIPTSSYQPLNFLISIRGSYDGIRFELAKTGTGEAVLANISAEISDNCGGLPQISATPLPNGASCGSGGDCASGICIASQTELPRPGGLFSSGFACAGCDPSASTCGGGLVCGVGDAPSSVLVEPIECIATGSRELGEACIGPDECASGKCTSHVCSACATTTDCAGKACSPSAGGVFVCGAGGNAGTTGAPCASDDDCVGTCDGAVRKECSDGRPCNDPGDCPVDSGLAPGACTTVGIQGGSCS